jgi:hypothetical protein
MADLLGIGHGQNLGLGPEAESEPASPTAAGEQCPRSRGTLRANRATWVGRSIRRTRATLRTTPSSSTQKTALAPDCRIKVKFPAFSHRRGRSLYL